MRMRLGRFLTIVSGAAVLTAAGLTGGTIARSPDEAELTRSLLGNYLAGRFAGNPNSDPAFWQPAPLLAKLVAEGKNFN